MYIVRELKTKAKWRLYTAETAIGVLPLTGCYHSGVPRRRAPWVKNPQPLEPGVNFILEGRVYISRYSRGPSGASFMVNVPGTDVGFDVGLDAFVELVKAVSRGEMQMGSDKNGTWFEGKWTFAKKGKAVMMEAYNG